MGVLVGGGFETRITADRLRAILDLTASIQIRRRGGERVIPDFWTLTSNRFPESATGFFEIFPTAKFTSASLGETASRPGSKAWANRRGSARP
jgi:hypothetical protein